MRGPRAVWPALLIVGTLAELRSLRRHDGATLSEVSRDLFHVDTPAGRVTFAAAWLAFSAWFLPHILHGAARAADAIATAIEEATP